MFIRAKRAASVVMALLMVLALTPVMSLAEEQKVYESKFDKDISAFTAMNTNIELAKQSGKSAMKISGGTLDWHGARLPAIDAGLKLDASYTISAMVYSEKARQVVMQLTSTFAFGGTDYKWLASPTLKAGEWTEITASIDITSAEYSAVDNLSFENKTEPYGDAFYVADVVIVKTADLAPPANETGKAQMPVVGFEDGTAQGFAGRNGTEVLEVSGSEAHSGSKSLKTSGRTLAWHAPSLRVESYIAQGMEYKISAWVKAITPASSSFKLSTQIGENDGASYINLHTKSVSTADGWVELNGTFRFANTSSGYVSIYIENDAETAEYYIDDISITELSSGGLNADLSLPSLAEIYKDYFLIGNIFSGQDLSGTRFDMLTHHFNALTPENSMKPQNVAPTAGSYSFAGTDEMLKIFDGFPIHGHTLAWHQQSPDWLYKDANGNALTRKEAEANMKTYVKEVAGHFKGKVTSWDVLNEAINDNPPSPDDWRGSLRASPWLEAFANGATGEQSGADYVDMLFREARKADPDAILYYNDYNLDTQSKAKAVANMVKELNDAWLAEGNTRLLIDGIGMQGHYSIDTNMENVESSIKLFASLGVEISFTELDITVPGVTKEDGLSEKAELKHASVYANLFVVLKKYADSVARVTLWGLDDGASWRSEQFPLLFNADLSAKQAYYAVADPEGFLVGYEDEDSAPRSGTAAFGTPVLDGTIDDVWEQAEKLSIDRMLQAWQTANGTARVLWDTENLYVLFEVNNAVLDSSSTKVHERDSVEAFLDEENCKKNGYKKDDGQYRVCYDGFQTYGDTTDGTGFESVAAVQGANYIVEIKIPFKTITPSEGVVIGFDAQINDGENGARAGIAKWCDPSDNSWQSTSGWGEVTLLGGGDMPKTTPPPADTAEPEPESESEPAPFNPLVVILPVAGAAIAGAAGLIIYKRRKK